MMKGALIAIIIFWVFLFTYTKYPCILDYLILMVAICCLSAIAGTIGFVIQKIIKGG